LVRGSFISFLERHAEPRLYGLVAALCFNVTSDLSPDLSEKLSRSGLIHLISTGGLHVFLIAGVVAWCLGQLPISRGWQLGVLFALVLLYASAAGFRPPMVRSVVMIGLFLSAYLVRREPDGLTLLAIPGIAYLLWSPESVANVGFQLSFLAVGGLVLFARLTPLGENPSLIQVTVAKGRDMLIASIVATLVTAPALVYHFQRFSVVSPLTNLLVIPVVTPVVVGALVAWLAHPFFPAVSLGILKAVVEPLAAWMMMVTEVAGDWPFSAIETAPVPALGAVAATILIFALWKPRRRTAAE
jgi:competence protein ComEC